MRNAALAVFVALIAIPATAQNVIPPPVFGETSRLQGGIGLVGVVPVGQFHRFVRGGAPGVLVHLGVRLGDPIFSLGGEVGWILYGDETRTVSLASVVPEVPRASIKVNTSNTMFTLHGRLRAQQARGRWRPYVDGLFGFTDIHTRSKVEGGDICHNACAAAVANDGQTQSRDFVLNYGGGAGVMIGLSSRTRAPRLDVSVRYLTGGRAEYLTEGGIRIEGDQLIRDVRRSRTDVVDVYVGVTIGR